MGAEHGSPGAPTPSSAPVVLLTGPTATGKTAAAVRLARALDGEIVSVDSGLVYRGLDIGTAKPSTSERGGVPHHLIDVREPWEPYSAAAFVDDALRTIAEIRARGRRPLLVGGTLLYVRALERGLAPLPPADPAVRAAIADEAGRRGWPALHDELARVDPIAAARIHPNDPQRLQRALEVHRLTGVALGELQRRTVPALSEPMIKLALVPTSRAWLHARIERRLAAMLEQGFVEEVRALRRDPRVAATSPAMRSVGYRQLREALDGAGEEGGEGERCGDALDPRWVDRALAATRRLAKRQMTWLRGMEDLHVVSCDTLDDDARDRALLAAVRVGPTPRSGAGDPPVLPLPPSAIRHRSPATMNDSSTARAPVVPPLIEQVGGTRLVPFLRIPDTARGNRVYGKLEGDNPAGSVKDRPAANMIRRAEERGTIRPGDRLIEATSGNTGIALAMVAAAMGYRLRLLMPDNMTDERKALMLAYGAELVLVSEEEGMEFARDEAAEMAARGEGLVLDQFANPDNWDAHYRSTGPEIWNATDGRVTHFVSSMGTTGTIMGVSRYLKERNPDVVIVGVQPEDGSSIPGIRRWPEAYLPKIYEPERVDRIIDVSASESEDMARRLAREEGILSGVSSGGALTAALTLLPELEDAVIVTIVCDRGDRYLSSGLFPAA